MKKLFTTDLGALKNNRAPFRLQNSKSNFVAACGKEQTINIFDRHGERKFEIPLPGEATDFVWDPDGDNLAIIEDKTSSVTIWDSLSYKISQVTTGIKDHLSAICWSRTGGSLAIGSEKGNLVIYSQNSAKKISLLGKHTRRINSAAWNRNNVLALAGDDKLITINSSDGDLLKQCSVRDLPSTIKFADGMQDASIKARDNTVSCVVGRKNLLILNTEDMDNPIELAFQQRYGDLVSYHWFGDGYVMVGFSAGYFIVVSTQKSELGKEIYQVRDHKEGLCDIALSLTLNRCATAGDHCVKIHDLVNVRELLAIIELEEDGQKNEAQRTGTAVFRDNRAPCQLQWSEDGQLMAVSTSRQLLHVFLSQLPMLAATATPRTTNLTARLTSLLEVTIEPLPFNKLSDQCQLQSVPTYYQTPQTVKVEMEPTFIGLGPKHLAVGMNNHAWFYELTETGIEAVSEYDYLDEINSIYLSENYAAACGPSGRLTLHWIDPKLFPTKESNEYKEESQKYLLTESGNDRFAKKQCTFPDSKLEVGVVTAFQLTENFLIYGTSTGHLFYFHLDDWVHLDEFHHSHPIVSLFTAPSSTRVAIIDDVGGAFIYNPLVNNAIELPDFPASTTRILWDIGEKENPLLVACDDTRMTVYRCFANGHLLVRAGGLSENTHTGLHSASKQTAFLQPGLTKVANFHQSIFERCRAVGVTRVPYGHVPLAVCSGEMCFLNSNGRLVLQTLATHSFRLYLTSPNQPSSAHDSQEVSKEPALSPLPTGDGLEQPDRKSSVPRKRSGKRDQSNIDIGKLNPTELQSSFEQALRVGCFEDACIFADRLDNQRTWNQLGMACLRVMHFDLAVRCFRRSNNPGLVLSVRRIQSTEDAYLLAGYVAMILKEFDEAEQLFLASSKPRAALEMRRDLLHWEAALQLARSLAPQEIPEICREYAVEMECLGDYVNALMHFERALTPVDLNDLVNTDGDRLEADSGNTSNTLESENVLRQKDEAFWQEHIMLCNAGIARNAIRLGDWKRGVQLAKESGNVALQKECADILEQTKQWQEAASLYEMAACYEAAITVYLRCKNFRRAGELLRRVANAPRLQLQYAKAREADGAYKEAVVAYEAAHDWDSVARLHLEKLGNPDEAVRVVQETKSIEGAKMIAKYFTRINDHASAIRFLVLSKCVDEAFQLARKHKKMELYAEVIGPEANAGELQSIACYFENEKNWYLAGKFYLLAKQYEKAVGLLLRSPYSENSPALDLALEAVGLAGDTRLTHFLIVYLMGEADGVPKDARHLFRLYMVLKQYKEAARTAVIIAREEQTAGNYRSAHDLLFSLVQELRQRDLRVPSEMADNLALLHSYVLAKVHVKHGDHLRAARMLIRVAENISKFPAHVVPILTSTVIECQKAGLKSASFGYAAMLLRPEYREKLDPKHRRKFETLVRRPDRKTESTEEDAENRKTEQEPFTPCPLCSSPITASSLYCTECRITLPYCIITGNHVVRSDFTVCPNCQFPAIYSEFMSYVENTDSPNCPMCSVKVERESIRRILDPSKILAAWISSTEEDEKTGEDTENKSVSQEPTI
ncbi:WD repeat-containing protein 19, variant 2 [Clonorchis sinensis]|uniref:WD repeat-containing protein 19 n=1 Tax=Clonorchis sinensis TaxID=79923 RepID=A0A8T1M8Q2_CLOSI|nr:WD repeat-containing protein 19 [Clonorchis sinensis]KAG5445533.1 WD repeat-containing protein 19, variant 2 [Clonorchis sinensis]